MGLTMDLVDENDKLIEQNEALQARIIELAALANQYKDEAEALRGDAEKWRARQCKVLRSNLRESEDLVEHLQDKQSTLAKENESLRKDAERYRGMFRDDDGFDYSDWWVGKSKDEVDAMIDKESASD